MKKRKLLWKVPLAFIGFIIGTVTLLLFLVVTVLYTPVLRNAAIEKGIVIAREQTGLDIDLGQFDLSLFHHSPLVLYHAWKGGMDLPLEMDIDSLFVGHRGQDTLIYAHSLHLHATLLTSQGCSDLLSVPIVIERLQIDETTFHSDSMIAAVGIDAIIGQLAVTSPGLNIGQGEYPIHGLLLSDTYVGVDLRETPPDTTALDIPPDTVDAAPMPMAFDVPDGKFSDVRFRLTPIGLDVAVGTLETNALADVGENVYNARSILIGSTRFTITGFSLPIDTFQGNAYVDLNKQLITSRSIHIRSDEMGAQAGLSATEMNLETMRVEVTADADYQGSVAQLHGYYDIDDEAYSMHVDVEKVNLSSILPDSPDMVVAGEIHAEGKGIDPSSPAMRSKVNLHLTDAIYDDIQVSGLSMDAEVADKSATGVLHLPVMMRDNSMQVEAQTEHQFRITDFMKISQASVDYRTQMSDVHATMADEDFHVQQMDVHFTTDTITSLSLATDGLHMEMKSPMYVLQLLDSIQPLLHAISDSSVINPITSLADLTKLDTLQQLIPDLSANITLSQGSPMQPFIEHQGLDIHEIDLSLRSDTQQAVLALNASIPDIQNPEDSTALRLPQAKAALRITMREGCTQASFTTSSKMTDGAMTLHDWRTDANLWFNVERKDNDLQGTGRLTMDNLATGKMDLGSRAVNLFLARSELYANAIKVDVKPDDIPLAIVDTILQLADLNLNGFVHMQATADGLPSHLDLSAEVLPLEVVAQYKPYDIQIGLGELPIMITHNQVDLNNLPIYGADSTYLSLSGGMNLESMQLDVTLAADSFAPAKLKKDGSLPVYGELATDIHGRVSGTTDSILADVNITLLPTTDITYPIDKKNLAQVKPQGTVHVRYESAGDSLLLLGQVNVDDGFIRYSPRIYPMMPFHVDSGSHVTFNGPIGQTRLAVSATQKVKGDVESEGEETRRVDFRTGVRMNGEIDSIGISSIDFFLEAPKDEEITLELARLNEETHEGLAAVLLATGMYVGKSNVAAQREGYALSSIINSRINAALANSKVGKIVDIDISSAQTEHAGGKTNDVNISISKSFFKDRFRITVGSTITDNPEVNKTSGLLSNLSAEYKLTKDGNVLLRAYADRDYNNVLEGELYKAGLGVRALKEWRRRELFRGDSIMRSYALTTDAGVAYRSNNSIGPDLTIKSSFKNLMGNGETFTIKGNGAYYWALRGRHPGDPKKTDTYKFGVNTSLVFPYLHWIGDNNPDGDTRYMFGYQYENIAGGYGVHKLIGSFTYFIRSSKYITHAFTPFSLSVVMMKAESDSLMDKAAEYPQLIKVIASDEFVPSIGYTFTYNDYRSKRAVNTLFEVGVKESGNLINALYCLAGHKWNEQDKKLGAITFHQFVKMNLELRNKFNFTDQVCIATRLYAGANIPLGNSSTAPLSEAFYAGGPNSMRAASPYAYGPGNFYSDKYNQNFFHAGDVKLEANFELRFPIVWKLYGAAFVDAGNVWNWYSAANLFKEAGITDYVTQLQLHDELYDGIMDNPELLSQIALGTGAGLRLDLDGLVIRLDIGVGIHAPYQTYKYDKKTWQPDKSQPINTYFNIPSAVDAIRVNFGIGYPF